MANGNLIAGFIQGFTGRQLDNIDSRRKMEQEMEKLKTLEQLRRDTAEWEESLPSKVQQRKESESRIKENEAQSQRDRDRLALDQSREEWDRKMNLENLKLQRAQLGETQRYHNESLKTERARAGLDTTGLASEDSASRVADALKSRYKNTINDILADGVDPVEVNMYALDFAKHPQVRGNLTGADLENAFLDGLARLRANPKAQKVLPKK